MSLMVLREDFALSNCTHSVSQGVLLYIASLASWLDERNSRNYSKADIQNLKIYSRLRHIPDLCYLI